MGQNMNKRKNETKRTKPMWNDEEYKERMREHQNNIRRKKRKKRIRFYISSVILLIILIAAALMITGATPVCQISEVSCTGGGYYSEDELAVYAAPLKGKSFFGAVNYNPKDFFRLRVTYIESQIQSLPYVKSAKVKYEPLHNIAIEVEEREPVVILSSDTGKSFLLDIEGYILEEYDIVDDSVCPLVKGIELSTYAAGDRLNGESLELYEKAADIINAFKEYEKKFGMDHLKEIKCLDVSDKSNIYLNYRDMWDIQFGESEDCLYKVGFLCTMFEDETNSGKKGKVQQYNSTKGNSESHFGFDEY